MKLKVTHKTTTVEIVDDGTSSERTMIRWSDQNEQVIKLIDSIIEKINKSYTNETNR